ncbi:MAG: hypothetical protein R3290_02030 [Acidimicrobiia bacterium]|nr:hypothetical protein [Acidimicrobiia bacterium]
MDTSIAMTRLTAAIEQQIVVAGADPQIEEIARTMVTALEPVVQRIAFDFAEQAAAEVGAQVPGYRVDVVLEEGEPALRVQPEDVEETVVGDSLDARITLRLPPELKALVEDAADQRGESLNTWLVKTLSSKAGPRRTVRGRRITGTIET